MTFYHIFKLAGYVALTLSVGGIIGEYLKGRGPHTWL